MSLKTRPGPNGFIASIRALNVSECPQPLQNEGGLIFTISGTLLPLLTFMPRAFATIDGLSSPSRAQYRQAFPVL